MIFSIFPHFVAWSSSVFCYYPGSGATASVASWVSTESAQRSVASHRCLWGQGAPGAAGIANRDVGDCPVPPLAGSRWRSCICLTSSIWKLWVSCLWWLVFIAVPCHCHFVCQPRILRSRLFVCVCTIWIDVKLLFFAGGHRGPGGFGGQRRHPRDPCKRTCMQWPWTATPSVGAVAGHCSDSPWAPSCAAGMSQYIYTR